MRRQLAIFALCALVPFAAAAEGRGVALETGIGFTSNPDTFLLSTELPIQIARDFDLGPLVQLGIGNDRLIVAPTVNVRYSFPLSRYIRNENPVWDRLSPVAHGGVGFAYLERDNKPGDDDDLGFLFNLGVGMQYAMTDRVSFGTRMTFNMMPGDVLDERFFFSWQVAQFRYRF
jgi:hypothetical protein